MQAPYKTLDVSLTPQHAVQYLRVLDEGNSPWSFVGSGLMANELVLYVDGAEAPVRITLNDDGTWTSEMVVEVPVQ